MTKGSGGPLRTPRARTIAAVLLLLALVGAAVEGGGRLEEVELWRGGDPQAREALLYGPYREVFLFGESAVPPQASVLLLSEWDPALIPYYLHPRRIYQLDVDPETNRDFMNLPPSPYPRRRPESFAVDWIIRLRRADGELVPEFTKTGRP